MPEMSPQTFAASLVLQPFLSLQAIPGEPQSWYREEPSLLNSTHIPDYKILSIIKMLTVSGH